MIRQGGPADTAPVLAMFDSAVAWLTSQGRTGQWGSEPFSGNPERVKAVSTWAASGGMRIAEIDGEPAGCLVIAPGPAHAVIPASAEPELYIQVLVIDHRFTGRSVGAALLAEARREAEAQGVRLLRVDCYAGDDGRLVRYYESQGFTRSAGFTVGSWPGQVLEQRF